MRHVDGVSPDWPLGFDVFEPYYGEAEALYHVHGQRGENPTEPWSSTNTETRMSDRTGPKPRIPY